MENNIEEEKRRSPRFHVCAGALAWVEKFKQGPLVDISERGLAFRYIDFDDQDEMCPNQSLRVIISHKDAFKLNSLPCRIVDGHCRLPKKHLSSGKMYKCRIEFDKLTIEQMSLLKYFIDNFTHPGPA